MRIVFHGRHNFECFSLRTSRFSFFRLSEIRDAVNEVRRKTDIEASERRAADQQTEMR